MTSKRVVQMTAGWIGRDLVKAAYRGLVGRDPDAQEADAHVAELGRSGKVSAMLKDIGQLPQAWTRALYAQPKALAEALRQGVEGPGAGTSGPELEGYARRLADEQNLPRVLAGMLADRRRRLGLLEVKAADVVQGAFQASLGRPADDGDLRGFSAQLMETGDIGMFLREVEHCDEHRHKFAGLGDERARTVTGLYRGLLARDPSDEELGSGVRALADGLPVENLVQDLVAAAGLRSQPAREACAQRVTAIYRALLGRDPEPEGLEKFTNYLAEGGDEGEFFTAVEMSEEHWVRLIDVKAEWFVTVVFSALLQREPDAEALEHFAKVLRETRDLRAFVAEVGFCREHRDKLLRSIAARRA